MPKLTKIRPGPRTREGVVASNSSLFFLRRRRMRNLPFPLSNEFGHRFGIYFFSGLKPIVFRCFHFDQFFCFSMEILRKPPPRSMFFLMFFYQFPFGFLHRLSIAPAMVLGGTNYVFLQTVHIESSKTLSRLCGKTKKRHRIQAIFSDDSASKITPFSRPLCPPHF